MTGSTRLSADSLLLLSKFVSRALLVAGTLSVASVGIAVSAAQDPSSLEVEFAREFPAVQEKLRGEARFERAAEEVGGSSLRGYRLALTPTPARMVNGGVPEEGSERQAGGRRSRVSGPTWRR